MPLYKKKKELKLNGTCIVCGDKASAMNHYGSKVCFSCRAFFRRLAIQGKVPQMEKCNRLTGVMGECQIDIKTRQLCSFCRYQKCCLYGMEPKFVMSRNQIEERREKAKQRRDEVALKKRAKRMQRVKAKEDDDKGLSEVLDLADMITFEDVVSDILFPDHQNEAQHNAQTEYNAQTQSDELSYVTLDYQLLEDFSNRPILSEDFQRINQFEACGFEKENTESSSELKHSREDESSLMEWVLNVLND